MPTADTLTQKYLSFLFKGPYGFGKTLAAATFAQEGPVELFYFDKNEPIELENFFKNIIKRPELLKNISWNAYSAKNANDYLNRLIALQKFCDKFAIISDSLTTMTASAVGWSMGFNPNKSVTVESIKPGMNEYQVETSFIIQAIDICKSLPCHNIWTAHPLPKLEFGTSTGADGRDKTTVTKSNSLVTYGSKIAGMVPGQFTEIYHFNKANEWDRAKGINRTKYLVSTEALGDEYAKTAIGVSKEFDITDRLFYEVWRENIGKR
jgi:hypothetical protein